jgi:hypothetical protein
VCSQPRPGPPKLFFFVTRLSANRFFRSATESESEKGEGGGVGGGDKAVAIVDDGLTSMMVAAPHYRVKVVDGRISADGEGRGRGASQAAGRRDGRGDQNHFIRLELRDCRCLFIGEIKYFITMYLLSLTIYPNCILHN